MKKDEKIVKDEFFENLRELAKEVQDNKNDESEEKHPRK